MVTIYIPYPITRYLWYVTGKYIPTYLCRFMLDNILPSKLPLPPIWIHVEVHGIMASAVHVWRCQTCVMDNVCMFSRTNINVTFDLLNVCLVGVNITQQ